MLLRGKGVGLLEHEPKRVAVMRKKVVHEIRDEDLIFALPCGKHRSDGLPAPKFWDRCLYRASAEGCIGISAPAGH